MKIYSADTWTIEELQALVAGAGRLRHGLVV